MSSGIFKVINLYGSEMGQLDATHKENPYPSMHPYSGLVTVVTILQFEFA
jgi:hypothetical protein